MADKNLIVKELNEIAYLQRKSEELGALSRAKFSEFCSRNKYKDGLIDEPIVRYQKKMNSLKDKVIDRYKSLFYKRGINDYEVVFKISALAASCLNAPMHMVCSPVNMELLPRSLRFDKGLSCPLDLDVLSQQYAVWTNDNQDYMAWFSEIEQSYDSFQDQILHDPFSALDDLVTIDKDGSIILHHVSVASGQTLCNIDEWLKRYDPNLVCIEEIKIGKSGKLKLVRGLRLTKGTSVQTEILSLD